MNFSHFSLGDSALRLDVIIPSLITPNCLFTNFVDPSRHGAQTCIILEFIVGFLGYDQSNYGKLGPLAQSVEQRTFNPWVVGSIPTGPTLRFPDFSRLPSQNTGALQPRIKLPQLGNIYSLLVSYKVEGSRRWLIESGNQSVTS